jgi:hypothetical protein
MVDVMRGDSSDEFVLDEMKCGYGYVDWCIFGVVTVGM